MGGKGLGQRVQCNESIKKLNISTDMEHLIKEAVARLVNEDALHTFEENGYVYILRNIKQDNKR